jgi:hypothetical protein
VAAGAWGTHPLSPNTIIRGSRHPAADSLDDQGNNVTGHKDYRVCITIVNQYESGKARPRVRTLTHPCANAGIAHPESLHYPRQEYEIDGDEGRWRDDGGRYSMRMELIRWSGYQVITRTASCMGHPELGKSSTSSGRTTL